MKIKTLILASLIFITGCDKHSVNDPVIQGNKISAAYNWDAVESLAASYSPGLVLKSIRSEGLNYMGYADKWSFQFSSGGIAVDYYFHTTLNEVKYDSTSGNLMTVGAAFISHKWFNSNEALHIAEKNGGKEFRDKYPDHFIGAKLGEPLVPNSSTYWYVHYRKKFDTEKMLMLTIDAGTGKIIYKFP